MCVCVRVRVSVRACLLISCSIFKSRFILNIFRYDIINKFYYAFYDESGQHTKPSIVSRVA